MNVWGSLTFSYELTFVFHAFLSNVVNLAEHTTICERICSILDVSRRSDLISLISRCFRRSNKTFCLLQLSVVDKSVGVSFFGPKETKDAVFISTDLA